MTAGTASVLIGWNQRRSCHSPGSTKGQGPR
jgi:hypothetical protein